MGWAAKLDPESEPDLSSAADRRSIVWPTDTPSSRNYSMRNAIPAGYEDVSDDADDDDFPEYYFMRNADDELNFFMRIE